MYYSSSVKKYSLVDQMSLHAAYVRVFFSEICSVASSLSYGRCLRLVLARRSCPRPTYNLPVIAMCVSLLSLSTSMNFDHCWVVRACVREDRHANEYKVVTTRMMLRAGLLFLERDVPISKNRNNRVFFRFSLSRNELESMSCGARDTS